MKFIENTYYHIFNRTINEEALFRSQENYLYFLNKYRYYLDDYFDTIGYCLMPTHFHFLVRVKENNHPMAFEAQDDYSKRISNQIAILLRSYTRAYNIMWGRHGNLFNQKTNAKYVDSQTYLITLLTYIHQNPVRSGIVEKAEEWLFSSYQDYIDLRHGTLPSKKLILENIRKEELKELTDRELIEKSTLG